jgi:hypothetical protein
MSDGQLEKFDSIVQPDELLIVLLYRCKYAIRYRYEYQTLNRSHQVDSTILQKRSFRIHNVAEIFKSDT